MARFVKAIAIGIAAAALLIGYAVAGSLGYAIVYELYGLWGIGILCGLIVTVVSATAAYVYMRKAED